MHIGVKFWQKLIALNFIYSTAFYRVSELISSYNMIQYYEAEPN